MTPPRRSRSSVDSDLEDATALFDPEDSSSSLVGDMYPQAKQSPGVSILRPPSSLPVRQTLLLLVTVLPEILIHHMLTPLYPYMTRSLLPPEKINRTGYYAGLLQSAYAFPTTFMDAVWGHLSDAVGRPPVLLGGLIGYGVGTLFLGLSTDYWLAVVSLCLTGFFSSNSVVAKGMIGEITHDDSSRAWAYSAYGVVFSAAGISGTLVGGFLADPSLFDDVQFLKKRPYFVACSFGTLLACLGVFVTLRWLTKSSRPYKAVHTSTEDVEMEISQRAPVRRQNTDEELIDELDSPTKTHPNRLLRFLGPYKNLLAPRTLAPILLFAVYKLTHTLFHTALPLLASAPVSRNGFGLPPKSTSLALTLLSVAKLITKASYYPIHQRLGTTTSYALGAALIVPAAFVAPVFGHAYMWPSIYVATILVGIGEGLCYLSSIMLLTNSVGREYFGLVHGVAGCLGSAMKTIGPAFAGWAWEAGVERGISWGVFAVVGVAGLVGGCVSLAMKWIWWLR
ncbi:hypothetical protein SpCBS45565_g01106 [Spizellomyces sp. 'palustris']|nr:hypothetical protein SpCBS45565_g01106 [Spizellomyces sp. 'palustris']